MLTHNTHYATFKVRIQVSFLDPEFHSPYCFSRVISVPRFSVSVQSTVSGHYNYSVRDRILEDIRLSVVDSILGFEKTSFDFRFISEQLDYSFRAKDLLSGLMFRGLSKFMFDRLRYFGDPDKPASSVPAEVCAVVRFSVSHIKTKGV